MNILNFDDHLLSEIICYLSMDDMYAIVETCKIFHIIVRKFLKIEIEQPSIYHIVGSVQLIEWAKSHPSFNYSSKYTKNAVKRNEIDILKYLIKDGCDINCHASFEAVKNDNFEILKYIVKNHTYNDATFNLAASKNNIKMMKYLFKKNCSFDHNTCNDAARSGSLEALKWLIENDCTVAYNIYDFAAIGGNIKLLNYLFSQFAHDLSKPHFSSRTMESAVENGRLSVLKWLIKKKCPMEYRATYLAYKNNNIKCLDYLINNKCPVENKLFLQLSKFGLNYNVQDVNIYYFQN